VDQGIRAALGEDVRDLADDLRIQPTARRFRRRKPGSGTPQVRWRLMHQSGRDSTVPRIRLRPHDGSQLHCESTSRRRGFWRMPVDADEKLFDRAEEIGVLDRQQVRVIVRIVSLSKQRASFFQDADHLGVALVEDVQADQCRHPALFGEFAVVIDRRDVLQAIGLSGEVVVRAMPGRNVDADRSLFPSSQSRR